MENIDRIKTTLEEASNAYYNGSDLIMSDEDFDLLKDKYEKLSGSKFQVGSAPPSNKGTISMKHAYNNMLGTLDKVNALKIEHCLENQSSLEEWLYKKMEDLNINDDDEIEIYISQKYDGNSILISYEDGKCKSAMTRGRDGVGLDLTNLFKQYKINSNSKIGIQYEALMSKSKLKEYEIATNKKYVNSRSAISGLLGRDDAINFSQFIDLEPLDYVDESDPNVTRSERILKMSSLTASNDFSKNGYYFSFKKNDMAELLEEISTIYFKKYSLENREHMDYMVDGLVIEILNQTYIEQLGFKDSRPGYKVALKFPYMEKQSIVEDIEFDLSKNGTGRITPMIKFKPVTFNGAVQKRSSIANYSRFKELKLGKGSKILVQYRNDCLSYIQPIGDNSKIKPFEFIKHCPECGSEITINENETFAFCNNEYCKSRIVGRINRYLTKLDIKGIAENTITSLYDNGLFHDIPSFYQMELMDIANVPGLGETSAYNILNALHNNYPYDYQILGGIGISDFGIRNAKVLLKKININYLLKLSKTEMYNLIINLDGFSEIKTNKFIDGFNIYKTELKELLDLIEFHITTETTIQQSSNVSKMKICITGSLNRFKNRNEIVNLIESKGHDVLDSVTKNVTHLVCNEPSSSSKYKKATDLKIPIITEDELVTLLN